MILSGINVSGVRLVLAGTMALLFGLLKTAPAPACGPSQPCSADAIDAFFLPLITASLGDPGQAAAFLPPPNTAPAPSPLPPSGGAVIIKPPPSNPASDKPPPPQSDAVVPAQRLLISQTLFAGALHAGGDVDMRVEMLPSIDGVPDAMPEQATLSGLALTPDSTDHEMLTMQQIINLPTSGIWPLEMLVQPVTMRVTCGACGPGGGVSRFDGTARLEMPISQGGHGKITKIDLHAPGGSTAHGEMHFSLRTSDGLVAKDDKARLQLVIDQETLNLAARLAAWRGQQQQMNGIFIATPTDDVSDPGGIAGQFSGCVPACGVEN
jgi:hypothetical protein